MRTASYIEMAVSRNATARTSGPVCIVQTFLDPTLYSHYKVYMRTFNSLMANKKYNFGNVPTLKKKEIKKH